MGAWSASPRAVSPTPQVTAAHSRHRSRTTGRTSPSSIRAIRSPSTRTERSSRAAQSPLPRTTVSRSPSAATQTAPRPIFRARLMNAASWAGQPPPTGSRPNTTPRRPRPSSRSVLPPLPTILHCLSLSAGSTRTVSSQAPRLCSWALAHLPATSISPAPSLEVRFPPTNSFPPALLRAGRSRVASVVLMRVSSTRIPSLCPTILSGWLP